MAILAMPCKAKLGKDGWHAQSMEAMGVEAPVDAITPSKPLRRGSPPPADAHNENANRPLNATVGRLAPPGDVPD